MPEKCRSCHGASLPTACMGYHRGLAAVNTCSRCHAQEEDIMHCLRDCCHAMEIWEGFNLAPPFFLYPDFQSWMKHIVQKDDVQLICTILWWVWRGRNMEILSNSRATKEKILHFIAVDMEALLMNGRYIALIYTMGL